MVVWRWCPDHEEAYGFTDFNFILMKMRGPI